MSEPDNSFDLVAAQAAYEVARLDEPLIRDIEHEFGEAINGHRNARRAIMAVYMRGFLDGSSPAAAAALEKLSSEKAGESDERDNAKNPGPDAAGDPDGTSAVDGEPDAGRDA